MGLFTQLFIVLIAIIVTVAFMIIFDKINK